MMTNKSPGNNENKKIILPYTNINLPRIVYVNFS